MIAVHGGGIAIDADAIEWAVMAIGVGPAICRITDNLDNRITDRGYGGYRGYEG